MPEDSIEHIDFETFFTDHEKAEKATILKQLETASFYLKS